MLSGKEQVARRESKAPYRRRPSVDLHVAVAQLSRVLQMVEAMTYICPIHETGCVHCRSLIHFAIVELSAQASPGFLADAQRGNANAS